MTDIPSSSIFFLLNIFSREQSYSTEKIIRYHIEQKRFRKGKKGSVRRTKLLKVPNFETNSKPLLDFVSNPNKFYGTFKKSSSVANKHFEGVKGFYKTCCKAYNSFQKKFGMAPFFLSL